MIQNVALLGTKENTLESFNRTNTASPVRLRGFQVHAQDIQGLYPSYLVWASLIPRKTVGMYGNA